MFSTLARRPAIMQIATRCSLLLFLLQIQSSFSVSDYSEPKNLHGIQLSTPEECARTCTDGEQPKYCYYYFDIEYYSAMSPACYLGVNNTKSYDEKQCIPGGGVYRTLLVINRQMPGPPIQVCQNDWIIVDVHVRAEGTELTIHWHGVFQRGFPYQDGVPLITQCPIGGAESYRYAFAANNAGTHFFHSHVGFQMADGIFGILPIRVPPSLNPHYNLYDEDYHTAILSDGFFYLMIERFPGAYRGPEQGQAAEYFLINGKGRVKDPHTGQETDAPYEIFIVEKGKKYRIRMICSFSTVCVGEVSIQSHTVLLISLDGEDIKPVSLGTFYMAAGQRVDFVLSADQPVDNYWMKIRGIGECEAKGVEQYAILRYQGAPNEVPKQKPSGNTALNSGLSFRNPLDVSKCGPPLTPQSKCLDPSILQGVKKEDKRIMQPYPDKRFIMYFDFKNYTNKEAFRGNNRPRFFVVGGDVLDSQMNNISFTKPSMPLLTQWRPSDDVCGTRPNDRRISCTNTYIVPFGSVVEIVLCDKYPLQDLAHPFHLHGYSFAVFDTKFISNETIKDEDVSRLIRNHTNKLKKGKYGNPPHRDTDIVPFGSCIIIRFLADNPGAWLFHCHFLVHEFTGMTAVFYVPPEVGHLCPPPGFPQCQDYLPEVDFSQTSDDSLCSGPMKMSAEGGPKNYPYQG